jgi:RNA polymerase sigma-70 factor (ECF subfamily)
MPGNDSHDTVAIPCERNHRGGAAHTAEATVDQRDLVERARRGDHDAFAALAGAAIARLDAAARLILRDRELARDAVQDAMMRAWRDLPGLRDPEKFDAWLHRLTVHACIDAARHRRRRPIEVELNVLDSPTVADISSQVIDRDLLDRGLRALEPEWRAIVVMHYYLGMPLPDAAAALGIPLGTAKSRLHRSLGVLRSTVGVGAAPDSALVTEGRLA